MDNKSENRQLPFAFSGTNEKADLPVAAPVVRQCKVINLHAVKIEHTRQIANEQLAKLGLIKKDK